MKKYSLNLITGLVSEVNILHIHICGCVDIDKGMLFSPFFCGRDSYNKKENIDFHEVYSVFELKPELYCKTCYKIYSLKKGHYDSL